MEKQRPRVSIGLPVYNGDEFLEEAIKSILSQTFQDFELIISDNASTDRTPEICQQYAALDSRIRYSRNPVNIGGGPNENRVAELSRGEDFCWIGHDDRYEPDYIASCVEILDQHPEIVHCYTIFITMNENGEQTGSVIRNHATSSKPHERFIKIACARDFLEESYGLTRSEVLRKTPLVLPYTASDRTLLAEVSLYGQFYQVPRPLFRKRFHSRNVYVDWRARMAWYNPNMGGKIVFPFWVQFFDYFHRIKTSSLSWGEKMRCRFAMTRWVAIFGKNMLKDLLYGAMMMVHSKEWRKNKYEKSRNWV
jgi:glycosyltransferase involved in cell wall biosynthesis